MGKQLMHIFMVLDKKLAQGASALLNFNKILSLERAMLKKIQIFCDVTPCQVVNTTNILGEHSSSMFLLTHLYIHNFSMVGSNFSVHTKDSMFGKNIFLYIHSPSPFLHSLHILTSFAPFFTFPIPFILLSNCHSIPPSSFLLYINPYPANVENRVSS